MNEINVSEEALESISKAIVQASNKLLESIKRADWTQIAINELQSTKAELETYKKALDMMSEELAMNKHCKMFPNCYLESDQENCQLIKECHDKEWLKQYYIEKARDCE